MKEIILTSDLIDALATFRDKFADGMLAQHIGPTLACSETDALADLLAALGEHNAAAYWVTEHARSDDDPDDTHYSGRKA